MVIVGSRGGSRGARQALQGDNWYAGNILLLVLGELHEYIHFVKIHQVVNIQFMHFSVRMYSSNKKKNYLKQARSPKVPYRI